MPRMPDWTDVGRAPRAETGRGIQRRRNPIPDAIAGLGQTIRDNAIADEKTRLEDAENVAAGRLKNARIVQQENDTLEYARARSDWNSRRLNEEDLYRPDNDPELGTWQKRYDINIQKHRSAAGSLISNPKLREKFEIETSDDVTSGSLRIGEKVRGITNDARKEAGFAAIEDNLKLAARPGLPKAESDKIIEQARADIDNMVQAGLLSPADAIAKRRAFAEQYASLRVQQDVQDDPAMALARLSGDGGKGGGASAVIRSFEGYRSTPYWDANAYRIGYGSDTITREDGTVVKVKPGMSVTREDAERDLERRMGEFQSGIVKDIGPEAWAKLPENVKAAVTSTAYNYGSLPGTVVNAIKAGNLEQVAQAVEGLAGHNKGINAGRRQKEAAIIRSGGSMEGLATPDYYAVLAPNDRLRLASSAEGEWAARTKAQQEATAIEKFEFKERLEDDVSQIENTGRAADIDPKAVVETLGETEAAKWLEKRRVAAKSFQAVTAMETMSNDEIEAHLDSLEPQAGTENFAEAQKTFDKAETRAKKLQDLRLKDPAKSVEESPLVRKAAEGLDPEKPETMQALVKARLQAQENVGIPPAMRQPITRGEAKEIIAPIERIIDQQDAAIVAAVGKAVDPASRRAASKAIKAQAEEEIRAMVQSIEQTYGPQAQSVLAFAIAESVRDKEIGNLTSVMWRKLSRNEKPTIMDAAGLDAAVDAKAADDAMSGENRPSQPVAPSGGTETPKKQGGGPAAGKLQGKPTPPKGEQTVTARPSQRAVQHLLKNPALAAQFDSIYGAGAAAEWLPKVE